MLEEAALRAGCADREDFLLSGARVDPLTFYFFFFNNPATPEIYTLSLHDALPIYHKVLYPRLPGGDQHHRQCDHPAQGAGGRRDVRPVPKALSHPQSEDLIWRRHAAAQADLQRGDSTRALQGRAIPAAQRAAGGGEHLPRHPCHAARSPAGAGHAASRDTRTVRLTVGEMTRRAPCGAL